jgi:hypothetical protein
MSLRVGTFGTGNAEPAEAFVRAKFNFRPRAIIERPDLLRPIDAATTNYGLFGKRNLPWAESRAAAKSMACCTAKIQKVYQFLRFSPSTSTLRLCFTAYLCKVTAYLAQTFDNAHRPRLVCARFV